MRPYRLLRSFPWEGLLLLSLLFVSAHPVVGQELDRVHFGIGYVVNAPHQMAGAVGYVLLPIWGGIGIYVDAKADIDSPSKDRAFDENLTSAMLETDPQYAGTLLLTRKPETSWRRSINVAVMRPLNDFLMVYGGGGYSQGEDYRLYSVPTPGFEEIGRALWVRDPRDDKNHVNLMFGFLLRMTPLVSSQIGYEIHPKGFTAGVSLRLPPW